MEFGDRLRSLRENRGLSLEALGKILSLHKSTISLYESNQRQPSQSTLRRITEFFGVTVDYLLGISNEPANPALPGGLSKLPPELQSFVVREAETGFAYLKILADAEEHGVTPEGLALLVHALVAARKEADETSRPQPESRK